jgi:hypothetical protein
VHVHGPFTLDDLFFITHPTAGPDFGYKSPFDNCQVEEWKEGRRFVVGNNMDAK